ncbi:MAG: peptidylprolyl isomerase [Flavobacteriales bacterium]|nr:peptidylprolyl isomerase [Flavobacteriales bacterium]
MATLNRIRAKSGVLIAIIGFALFAFVLGDLFKSGSSILRGNQLVVGVIDGQEISYTDFNPQVQRTLDVYKRQGLNSITQVSNIVWTELERKTLIDKEVEKLGLNIGEDELWNLIVTDPSIQGAPAFKTPEGFFDENKVKEYLAYLRDNSGSNAQAAQLWYDWVNFEKSLKERGIVESYYNLIGSGLSATDLDGKFDYKFRNDQVNAKYVYLPFASVENTEVKVEDADISSYVSSHKDDFKVEAARDIQYVYFKVNPSLDDEAAVREELLKVISDRVEFLKESNTYDTIPGFANTTEDSLFVNAKSDVNFDPMYYHKGKLPKDVEEFAFNAKVGDLFGPYKDGETFKVSKLVDVKEMPDSVKASHILISFVGANNASPDVVRTDAQAKAVADSLASVLNNKKKADFAGLAKEFSNGPTAEKGGDLGWFTYGRMVPEFNSFAFNNKKGEIGVVKTVFGYHVVKIEDQKNNGKAVKIATIVRSVLPSESSDNDQYTKASSFAAANKTLESFRADAAAKGYEARNVEGIKAMEFNVPGIGDQRDLVKWAFNEETMIGDTKLQAVEDGYVVALLFGTSEAGTASVDVARSRVEPIIINEKKAEILKNKISGSTLEDIAKSVQENIRTVNSIHFENPIIPGAGREPKVVGELFGLKQGVVSDPIVGSTGVFVVQVEEVKQATELPNYATYSNRIDGQVKSRVNYQVFDALKNSVEIKDNRARFY